MILRPKDAIKCGICQSEMNFNLDTCMSCIHREKFTAISSIFFSPERPLVFVVDIQLSFVWEGTNIIFHNSSVS